MTGPPGRGAAGAGTLKALNLDKGVIGFDFGR